MPAPNPTVANTNLWAAYLERSWAPWIEPVWGREAVTALAEGVSSWMSALMGPTITRMYVENAAEVSAFVETQHVDPQPRDDAQTSREPALLSAPDPADAVPAWLTSGFEAAAADVPASALAGAAG